MKSYVPTYLKSQNRIMVLDLFFKHHVLARTDISKMTGISLPTVMKITDFLRSKHFLIDETIPVSVSDNGLGRKSQLLQLNENAYSTIGIYFEGTYLYIGLVNLGYSLLDVKTFSLPSIQSTEGSLASFSYDLMDTIDQLRDQHPETQILGIGFAINGVVDCESRQVMRHTRHSFLDFYEMFPAFKNLDIPLYIENDINAASLGEITLRKQFFGSNLIYLSLGTGFGGGIIIDNKIWHGSNNFAGDVGNMILSLPDIPAKTDPEDIRIENKISLDTLQKQFAFDISRPESCSNEKKKAISEYVARYMIPAIYNLSYALDIPNFVLAGVTTDFLGDELFRQLESVLSKLHIQNRPRPNTHIVPAISKNAGVVGASIIAFSNCLPTLLNEDA